MTPAEAASLLTICAAYDNRKPDADQAMAWAMALADLRFVDARAAVVSHYQRSEKWLMPVHVIQGVKAMRTQRVKEHLAYFQPPDGLSNEEYVKWQHETIQAIGDGDLTKDDAPAALPAGRDVVGELESRGLRTNTIPTERVSPFASRARQEIRRVRSEIKATEPPNPEPLVRPEDRLREPEAMTRDEGEVA